MATVGGPPAYTTTTQVVTVVQPQTLFSPFPMQVTCGNCHQTVITSTAFRNGGCTWLATIFMLIVCCPFFWIPLVIESCKDVHHVCPGCGATLGIYKKL